MQVSAEPKLVAENIFDSIGQFAVSATGALAYRVSGAFRDAPLASFDRTGQQLESVSLPGSLQAPSLSRDGKRVAIERTDPTGSDIWLIDLVGGTNTRLTDDPGSDIRPVLSPDGERVAFARGNTIFLKSSSGTGTEERLVEGEVTDWSPDGKIISFIRETDVWTVPLDGDRTPTRLVQTKGNDRRARFSPDGKWIAYESDFSGRFEVYVQRFPPTAERVCPSMAAVRYWRSDGMSSFAARTDHGGGRQGRRVFPGWHAAKIVRRARNHQQPAVRGDAGRAALPRAGPESRGAPDNGRPQLDRRLDQLAETRYSGRPPTIRSDLRSIPRQPAISRSCCDGTQTALRRRRSAPCYPS